MTFKAWVKFIFHWVTFLGAIAAAAYVLFFMNGDHTWKERGLLAAAALGAIFTATKALLPTIDREIDGLPDIPRRGDLGATLLDNLVVAIVVGIVSIFLGVSFVQPRRAHADEVKTLDRDTSGNFEFSLTAGAVATMFKPSTNELVLGAPLGTCFGVRYVPKQSELSGCFYFQMANKGQPNRYLPSIQGSYKGLVGLGAGLLREQGIPGWPVVLFFSGTYPLL